MLYTVLPAEYTTQGVSSSCRYYIQCCVLIISPDLVEGAGTVTEH